VLLLLPVFYVLSSGPVVWLENNSYIPDGVVERIYAPVLFVSRHFSAIREWLRWYWNMFLE
jgi:hypothetical protein